MALAAPACTAEAEAGGHILGNKQTNKSKHTQVPACFLRDISHELMYALECTQLHA